MKKNVLVTVLSLAIFSSCVSKKKYVELQNELSQTKSELQRTAVEKEEAQRKLDAIQERVAEYNARINSLREENDQKLEMHDKVPVSANLRKDMRETLRKVDPAKLAQARTLEDSINLAVSYNLKQSISDKSDTDDIDITVDKSIVMINVSDKLLFNSGSFRLSSKSDNLMKRLAEVIKAEPSMEVMIEGHTDSQKLVPDSWIQDNWELSVRRATSIVRMLQDKHNVDPAQMIAAGRSSYVPIADNDTKEGRAMNRRTRIILIPDLDKFFSLLQAE